MVTDNTQQNNPQGGGATGTVERSERSTQKPSEKMTALNPIDESIDPQEYSRLLDLYDNSFRNIAEGEVVKGTVLKVTASEVIVDVGYKSDLNNPQGGGATGTVERSERSTQKPSEKMTALNPIDESIDPQEYSRLLDLYDNSFRNIAEGEVVKGTVLKVSASEVIVDVGYK